MVRYHLNLLLKSLSNHQRRFGHPWSRHVTVCRSEPLMNPPSSDKLWGRQPPCQNVLDARRE